MLSYLSKIILSTQCNKFFTSILYAAYIICHILNAQPCVRLRKFKLAIEIDFFISDSCVRFDGRYTIYCTYYNDSFAIIHFQANRTHPSMYLIVFSYREHMCSGRYYVT